MFQLPGETVEQAEARSKKISADFDVANHLAREEHAFENATAIYLAKIVSRDFGEYSPPRIRLPSTKIQPVHGLKGRLPSVERTLTDQAESGMCTDVGDGHGSLTNAGELIVVFEGLPISRERPRGIDSFRVDEVRTIELLDKLREFGKDLED